MNLLGINVDVKAVYIVQGAWATPLLPVRYPPVLPDFRKYKFVNHLVNFRW